MRASESTYREVAERCHAFAADSKDTFTNRAEDLEHVSCINCKHFDEDSFCRLDLYDKIVAENHLA